MGVVMMGWADKGDRDVIWWSGWSEGRWGGGNGNAVVINNVIIISDIEDVSDGCDYKDDGDNAIVIINAVIIINEWWLWW